MNIYTQIKSSFKFLYLIILFFFTVTVVSCISKENKESYLQGDPVILKKEYAIIPGTCIYTYEGYGRKETFEDKCDKYSVGDKLGGNGEEPVRDSIINDKQ